MLINSSTKCNCRQNAVVILPKDAAQSKVNTRKSASQYYYHRCKSHLTELLDHVWRSDIIFEVILLGLEDLCYAHVAD